MDDRTVIARSDSWLGAWVGKELMMMNGATGAYLSLSETGGRIWDLLVEKRSVGQLCIELSTEYGVSPEEVRPEVVRFVEDMIEEKTLHAVPSRDR